MVGQLVGPKLALYSMCIPVGSSCIHQLVRTARTINNILAKLSGQWDDSSSIKVSFCTYSISGH